MELNEIKQTVMNGKCIDCTKDEYHQFVRKGLQDFAGESIDNGQVIYTQIALNEVKRLDKKFKFEMFM